MIINHFTATGIVLNPNREVLMIYHNKLQVWLPPGGHIDENELPTDAVLREIFEETGVQAEIVPNKRELDCNDTHVFQVDMPFVILLEDIERDGMHNHIDMIYLCTAKDTKLKPQENEVSDIGWFSLDQVKALKTFDNVITTIDKAFIYYYEGR